ncbi:uncharacterized protein F5891DRAFT_984854 [Suillus fuscotomentosus]|uniref:Uncharacterized protein n=1 Tax=Suillus fuscotomentosus TaxID=1912939 RepID=A0AAD4DVC0_9AGAM|nr:uncharacterized protein F5891DRAFT_984854 [Suillus fuscotomentosus]KAG1894698.1 hypothetical protein F5891DRAFT_984854 [Suillus fuscotomentosus]
MAFWWLSEDRVIAGQQIEVRKLIVLTPPAVAMPSCCCFNASLIRGSESSPRNIAEAIQSRIDCSSSYFVPLFSVAKSWQTQCVTLLYEPVMARIFRQPIGAELIVNLPLCFQDVLDDPRKGRSSFLTVLSAIVILLVTFIILRSCVDPVFQTVPF